MYHIAPKSRKELQINRGYSIFCHEYDFYLSSEVKNIYFMSGEATNEIYNFFTLRDEIKSHIHYKNLIFLYIQRIKFSA